MIVLVIVQVYENRWRIETKDGKIFMEERLFPSLYDAEEFIKNYVTSFIGYSWEVRCLKK